MKQGSEQTPRALARKPRTFSPWLSIILVALALTALWFRKGLVLGSAESGLPFYDIERQADQTKHTWVSVSLGNTTGLTIASWPTYWVLAQFSKLGVPGFLLEAIVFWLLFVTAGLSIYKLTKLMFVNIGGKYAILAVFAYWFNPFSLVNVWNRFLYNYMVFFALLPLATFLFLKGIRERKYSHAFLVGLITGIFSYALNQIPFLFLLWMLLGLIAVFEFLVSRSRSEKKFSVIYYAIAFVSSFAVNFWWLIQVFNYATSSDFQGLSSGYFSTSSNLSVLTGISQILGRLDEVIRMRHYLFYDAPTIYWAEVFNNVVVTVLEFWLVFLVFWVILVGRKRKSVVLLGLVFLLGVFVVKGTMPPLGEIYKTVFILVKPLQVFRNPFEKFGFVLPLAFAPLLAYGADRFIAAFKETPLGGEELNADMSSSLKGNRGLKSAEDVIRSKVGKTKVVLYLSVLITLLGIWGMPYWSGLVFTGPKEFDYREKVTYSVNVPEYYEQADGWFQNQDGQFRFISFPLGLTGMTYNWPDDYSGVELSDILFENPGLSYSTAIPYFEQISKSLEELFLTYDNFPKLASPLNVKYILTRSDLDWKSRSVRDPRVIADSIASKPEYKKEGEFGNLSIYSVSEEYFKPKIWAAQSAVRVYPNSDISDLLITDASTDSVFYSAKKDFYPTSFDGEFIKQSTINYIVKGRGYTVDDAIASLLHVSHMPNSRFYPIVRVKEKIERAQVSKPSDLFIFDITHLGKRVVELYRLSQENAPFTQIKAAVDNYSQSLETLKVTHPDKLISSPSNIFRRTVMEELAKHIVVISAARDLVSGESKREISRVYSSLQNDLVEMGYETVFPLIERRKEKSTDNFWVYKFGLDYEGEYDIHIANNEWEQFYEEDFDTVVLQVDDSVREFPVLDKREKIIKLGSIALGPGIHEVSISAPERKNLVSTQEIIIDSQKDTITNFRLDPFDPFADYEITFDYWIRKGESFRLQIFSDNDPIGPDGQVAKFDKEYKIDGYNNYFKSESTFFAPRRGAQEMILSFVAEDFNDCEHANLSFLSSCDDPEVRGAFSKKTEVVIENLRVRRVFDNAVYLSRNLTNVSSESAPEISFEKIDPTKYVAYVSHAQGPYILVFSELFNTDWKVRVDDLYVDEEKHFLANSYANGWVMDKPGDYSVTIEFIPEKSVGRNRTVSLFFFVLTLTGFAVFVQRESRNEQS